MLTELRQDPRAQRRIVVLAAGTLAVATLSSVTPVPEGIGASVTTTSVATSATTTSATTTSTSSTLAARAAGALAGSATAQAIATATITAPRVRPKPKPQPVVVRAASVVAPYRFGTAAYSQWHAKRLMATSRYGWRSTAQYQCLVNLWNRESHWNYRSHNRSSGAHGIPQALPGSKMRTAGTDWLTNPVTQIRWGLGYIKSRYGSPCGAWRHFQSRNWY